MKNILIDHELYEVSDEDEQLVSIAFNNCVGSCNEYSLQSLRDACIYVKNKYDSLPICHIDTPEDQNIEEVPYDEDELPF